MDAAERGMRRDISHAFAADIHDPAIAHSFELLATANKHLVLVIWISGKLYFYRMSGHNGGRVWEFLFIGLSSGACS